MLLDHADDVLDAEGIRSDLDDSLHVHKVVALDDDGAGRLLALDDKGHRVPIHPGRENLADEGLVLATLVLEADRVVDVRALQFDQHLLVYVRALREETLREQIVAQIVRD
eukprot:1209937-Prymnesium_polylepis.1